MPCHVGLDVEEPPTSIPLTLVQLHPGVNGKMDLERRRPLEYFLAHGALVFLCTRAHLRHARISHHIVLQRRPVDVGGLARSAVQLVVVPAVRQAL